MTQNRKQRRMLAMKQRDDQDDCDYIGPDRRKHCDTVILVSQKFSDFIERYERDREFTRVFRENQTSSVKELSEFVIGLKNEFNEMRKPYRILIWVITIATGAFLIEIIRWCVEFFRDKVIVH